HPGQPAPGGGRLFALGLVALGLGLLAIASAPLGIAGAQQQPAAPAPATQLQLAGPDAQAALANFHCSQLPCDPGVRGGTAGAGGPLANLDGTQSGLFTQGQTTFQEKDGVEEGLGPRFNLDQCSGCHAQPAVGGSSPAANPQAAAVKSGGMAPGQTLPSFITADGPVREARFVKKSDGSPDGGVHDLFVISGRPDAAGCNIRPEDFQTAVRNNNVIFRIPTPTFGAGLIAAIPDSAILANMRSSAGGGISGHENRTGNDGTITRFGWKAQNKSLAIFSGEAYNVEQGVSNELFPNEREEGCLKALNTQLPEDFTGHNGEELSDATQFAVFMNLLAAPTPLPSNPVTDHGLSEFKTIGCAQCHTPSLRTGASPVRALNNVDANLYSDLLVHNMGQGLADNVPQGNAAGDEFRTAPLWGVGQRIFFLHDGRTDDLVEAINQHKSSGSEASGVVDKFNALNRLDQEAIILFLRSL
ncbi:MAG TPA: di-heme oxidoredictase family protein, partial [Chloroflexota bacterium]